MSDAEIPSRGNFDWNPRKAAANFAKHGIRFEEAQTVFDDPWERTLYDAEHSMNEDRFTTLGRSALGRLLVVVHTERVNANGEEIAWIISTRPATRKEAKTYAEKP